MATIHLTPKVLDDTVKTYWVKREELVADHATMQCEHGIWPERCETCVPEMLEAVVLAAVSEAVSKGS